MHFPWTVVLALIAFAAGLVVSVIMLWHFDEDKISRSRNPFTRNYIFFYLSNDFLTPAGRRLRRWQIGFLIIFFVAWSVTIVFYGR